MNQVERRESRLPERLAELGGTSSDYTNDILGRTARTRQRPAWTFPGRWFPMLFHSPDRPMASTMPSRMVWILLIVALLAAALAAGGAFIVGSGVLRGPGPNDLSAVLAALPPTACPAGTPLHHGDIATIAGTGKFGSTGDGAAALAASLYTSDAVPALDSLGNLYFYDRYSREIRRVTTDGLIDKYYAPDSMADNAVGLGMDPADDLLVADYAHNRIWQVAPDGTVTSLAGTGQPYTTFTPGPADQTTIGLTQVARGPDGSLYFDGAYGFAVVTPDGMVQAFAGTATPGFSGDGGPVGKAQLSDETEAVAVDAVGNIYLGDTNNHRIRKVTPAGIITTFAGNGTNGWAGDGGQATDASLGLPIGVAVDTDGTVYISDQGTSTVRKVTPAGVISTVAGTGTAGYSGDCGPAAAAELGHPYGIAVRDGVLYIMDEDNYRVRMVVP